ncbi:MAG: calcium-binding protein [Actinobacteria bacterium]|nr:calcium-binding protein [Actinomycetota bacterium]
MLYESSAPRSSRMLLLVAVLASFVVMATASAAQATTVNATSTTVRVTAAAGEANNVSISFSGGSYAITDSGTSTLIASTGCTKTGSTVYCAKPAVQAIYATLGDGDNALTVGSGIPSALYAMIVRATSGSDDINTTALPSSASSDISLGGGDYETVSVGPGSSSIETGDVVYASTVYGGSGSDIINATGGDTIDLSTQYGGSVIYGFGGNDVIDTTSMSGSALIDPGTGHDALNAGPGGDYVIGSDGIDTLYLGDGDNVYEQYPNSTGSSTVTGGDGNDSAIIWPYAASVSFDGGAGIDDVDYRYSPGAVAVSLDGVGNDGNSGSASDNIHASVENIGIPVGGMKNNDTLVGSAAANIIHGRTGSDVITGGGGADSLYGESGNDTLYANDGVVDTIDCGTNTDTVYADFSDVVNANCENVFRS